MSAVKLGPVAPSRFCGYSPGADYDICGLPVVVHAKVASEHAADGDGVAFAVACSEHRPVLLSRAVDWHPHAEEVCAHPDAWWMPRTPGTSFCYLPADDDLAVSRVWLDGFVEGELVPA